MKRLFLTDFDGTITLVDTCYTMVSAFAQGDWASLNDLWEKKLLDTAEVARQTFAMFQADQAELDRLLDAIPIDSGFAPFVAAVRARGDELVILSDGYDYAIRHILGRLGLDDIPFHSNSLEVKGRVFSMQSGRRSDCGLCGTCKKDLRVELGRTGWQTVYIGDGSSDECVSVTADLLFAKDSLARHCAEKGIMYHPFNSFIDILDWYQRTE